jgi:hypothetical protein
MTLILMGQLFVLLLAVRNFLVLILPLLLGIISGAVRLHFLAGGGSSSLAKLWV